MRSFISLTTSLSSISFDGIPCIVLCVGRGQRPERGRGRTPSVYLAVAKKNLLLRIPVEVITMFVVVAECGLLLAWGRGVALQ